MILISMLHCTQCQRPNRNQASLLISSSKVWVDRYIIEEPLIIALFKRIGNAMDQQWQVQNVLKSKAHMTKFAVALFNTLLLIQIQILKFDTLSWGWLGV